jgi:hypothetical protein
VLLGKECDEIETAILINIDGRNMNGPSSLDNRMINMRVVPVRFVLQPSDFAVLDKAVSGDDEIDISIIIKIPRFDI